MPTCIRRREFIATLGGAAVWPLATHAQQPDRMQRIGVLIAAEVLDDPIAQARVAAFREGLEKLQGREASKTCRSSSPLGSIW
jgi:putative ABC transport system substrate-binding protein